MRSGRAFVRATRSGALFLSLVGAVSLGSSVNAGVLASAGGSIPTSTGTQLFDNSFGGFSVSANVDFAVFAPGAFGTAFPGEDPSGGAHYVYAYQIENLDTDIVTMTVGLDGDEILGTVGFVGGVGLVDPAAALFVGAGPSSVAWDFDPAQLTSGLSSAVLYFTSADAPGLDSATVLATFADSHDLPSPLPEPTALSLLALGAGFICYGQRHRV